MCSNQLDLKNQLHRDLVYNAILSNDSSIGWKRNSDPAEYAALEMFRKYKSRKILELGNGGCKKFEDSKLKITILTKKC